MFKYCFVVILTSSLPHLFTFSGVLHEFNLVKDDIGWKNIVKDWDSWCGPVTQLLGGQV